MGCSSSTEIHPSIYNETLKKRGDAKTMKEQKAPREENPKHLKGDYSQYQVAKHIREQHHKDRQIKLFLAADEMSGKMLEEREMLSLGTRSRGTSRNTSRAASPSATKRNGGLKETTGAMTPVREDMFSAKGSFRRDDETNNISSSTKKKHKSNKTKTKKHRKSKKSKKNKRVKMAEHDDSDSGLDEEEIDTDNKENEIIAAVADANSDAEHAHTWEDSKNRVSKHQKTDVNENDTGVSENKNNSDVIAGNAGVMNQNGGVPDRTMYSSSKDSGIHVTEGTISLGQTVDNTGSNKQVASAPGEEERSDSRI